MKKRWVLLFPMLAMVISGCNKSTNNELEYGTYYQWNGSAEEIKITSETTEYRTVEITSSKVIVNYYNGYVLKTTERPYFIRGNSIFAGIIKDGEEKSDGEHYQYLYDFGEGYLKYIGGYISMYGSASYYRFYINKSFAKKLGVTIIDEVSEK